MFDKYMIVEDTLRNTVKNGSTTGFEFGARLPYYRGLGLSMVEDIGVSVDGQKIAREHIRLTLRGRTYTMKEMETEFDDSWQMGEIGTITVDFPGGIKPGSHQIELYEQLRVSYMPVPVVGKDAKQMQVRAA